MTNIIGKSLPRIDARSKVIGETQYSGDITMPNMAYMKVLFARRPHALIKNIDTSKAEGLEGVIAVFTAKDVPVNEYGLQIPDQPVLCDKVVRFVGDHVAVVVAESEKIADQARKKIVVEYEDLPVVTDPRESAKPDAMLLHADKESNIVQAHKIRKGDVEAGFAQAEVIIEDEMQTPFQEHAYLQPEAGVAYMDDDGRLVVKAAGQWLKEEQEQVAHSLGLPEEKVRIIHPAIGGAFGGREDISVQIVLGLAAMRLSEKGIDRPVKIIWTREESIIGHSKRHPFYFKTRWGATKDGKIVAAEVDATSDAGAYMYTSNKVLGNATLMTTGPYEIPNVKVDTRSVYTNNIPTGALRGFGAPQGAFVAEMMVNKLAEALEMDPVELRMKNILHEGSLMSVQTPLTGNATIDKVTERCAEEAGWENTDKGWDLVSAPKNDEENPHLKRGIGFACGFKNTGFSFGYQENSWAKVEIHGDSEIERVVVHHGAADVGQGAHTVIMQAAAEAVGASYDKVEFVGEDSDIGGDSGSTSASRMTFMALNSVKGAGERALEKWEDEVRPAIAEYKYLAPKTTPYDPETGKSIPNVAYGHCAQVADLEVDTETGHIHIHNMISTSDLGKVINPQQVVGQIEGGTLQMIGHALMEDFIHQDGYVQTAELSTYLIPTVLDIPTNFKTVIVEYADPNGPWGARGVGEMMTVPTTAAIVAAVHNATGVWFNEFPLTPERVLRGLGKI
ncbi:MAG: xanthine dehydrogenase family protein molybdopterin-binding subunit [Anaerolineae bacterium]|jgi:CO/xanthine dehydrogenase Mo-binding subunit|nr:xanthine dehydrogenase family protein molybdopterin-binding subunit [Anaerolineae bacterium]MBT4309331.1 xanthine dehydrogenase family protein molybdopterin-binding subunit [Anaerolineae bacterium]MBT4458184.1 xanthine dehydrogenase family protein molybdopterin-binding subunit [Anaerolineae bacterium]MBT4842322.1 xanthine dehydrogenase family protein molybdopterin-binding subunit [Anaerolineae bacterium]MBT6062632.1 xanthine dehydrogenase family protein molybdopterin-binding subunit [Anaerol